MLINLIEFLIYFLLLKITLIHVFSITLTGNKQQTHDCEAQGWISSSEVSPI